jgi:hypothetical protein
MMSGSKKRPTTLLSGVVLLPIAALAVWYLLLR